MEIFGKIEAVIWAIVLVILLMVLFIGLAPVMDDLSELAYNNTVAIASTTNATTGNVTATETAMFNLWPFIIGGIGFFGIVLWLRHKLQGGEG